MYYYYRHMNYILGSYYDKLYIYTLILLSITVYKYKSIYDFE